MALTTSQKINETKRSFHKYLADNLPGVQIDFDDQNFTPPDNEAFLVVRYLSTVRESCGIGDVVSGDSPNLRGNWRHIDANLSIYKRNDAQKADVGELYDDVADLLKVSDLPLFDFTNPQYPVEVGKILLDPLEGGTGPSPIEGRERDRFMKRELIEAGFAWMALGVQLSVLEEY